MKTLYILHGGESSRRTAGNDVFFKAIIDATNKDIIKILCVYFARPEHRWQESFYEDKCVFEEQGVNKSLYMGIASKDDFEAQIRNTDVIFLNGGFKGFLKDALLSITNLNELLANKVIVGISAGANILSRYYYSQGGDEIREGVGLLPIKVFCHYSDKNKIELSKLEEYGEDLPIYKIPEEQFIVIEQ
jgi:peptidase E